MITKVLAERIAQLSGPYDGGFQAVSIVYFATYRGNVYLSRG